MSVLSHPLDLACRRCLAPGMVYEDQFGHLWCAECEAWNGLAPVGHQPSLFAARFPGDRWAAILS
jgi:hypothetical protein